MENYFRIVCWHRIGLSHIFPKTPNVCLQNLRLHFRLLGLAYRFPLISLQFFFVLNKTRFWSNSVISHCVLEVTAYAIGPKKTGNPKNPLNFEKPLNFITRFHETIVFIEKAMINRKLQPLYFTIFKESPSRTISQNNKLMNSLSSLAANDFL